MRTLFLIYHGFEEYNGISKKVRHQVDALKECGIETHVCYLTDKENYKARWIDGEIINDYGKGFYSKIQRRSNFSSVIDFIKKENISLVYARHDHNSNPFTIRLYKKIRKTGCKLVLEIPTYPYDSEYKNLPFRFKIDFYIDRFFRKELIKHIDYIITFSQYKIIFGKEAIQISNGVDFSQIPIKRHFNEAKQSLHLIGVAEVHFWHGFDRVVAGLKAYYKTNTEYKVYFHIVGKIDNIVMNAIKKNLQDETLQEYIIFHGTMYGEELDILFEKIDFGIGSLGRHRSGIFNIKTLKNREYAARGIPFIYSEIDEDFESMPYIIKAEPDDSPINIKQIILFYHSKKWEPLEIRNSIKHLSWKEQMQKVLNRILTNSDKE